MLLLPLLLTTMSLGLVLGVPQNVDVSRRDIQSDGGYPKFPPEEQGLSNLARARIATKEIPVKEALRSTRDILDRRDDLRNPMGILDRREGLRNPRGILDRREDIRNTRGILDRRDSRAILDRRDSRGIADMNMKDAYAMAQEMYAAYQKNSGKKPAEGTPAEETAGESDEDFDRSLSRESPDTTPFNPSEMSPELQQFWEKVYQMWVKHQEEQEAAGTKGEGAKIAAEKVEKDELDSPNYVDSD